MTIFRHGGKTTTGQVFSSKFIAKWDTTQPGSANDTVVLPLVADGSYNFYIDWGDGNRDTITGHNQPEVTHQYSDTGIYTIRVVSNNMVGWQFNDSGDDDKLTEIMEWGPLRFVSDDTNLFKGCSNLTLSTTSDPPFNADAAGMFQDCSSLTGNGGNILNWDMSAVTGMNFMLAGCTSLDPDLSNWDVSSIENAEGFMSGAGLSVSNYDKILSGWSSQSVQSGVNISFGNTQYSEVTGKQFRDILTSSSTGWIITDGGGIAPPSPFRTTWDTRINIADYTTTSVSASNKIVLPLHNDGTYDFEVDWGDGTSDHITTASTGAKDHTYSTPGIYTITITGALQGFSFGRLTDSTMVPHQSAHVTDAQKLLSIDEWGCLRFLPADRMMFRNTFSLTSIPTDTAPVLSSQNCSAMFNDTMYEMGKTVGGTPVGGWWDDGADWPDSFSDFSHWDMSNVTSIGSMFQGLKTFNANVGEWDTSNVTTMAAIFSACKNFNNGGSSSISGWDTSNVTNMNQMFRGVEDFNQDISYWDTSNVEYMIGTFSSLVINWSNGGVPQPTIIWQRCKFDQNIGAWDVSSVKYGSELFAYNNRFNNGNSPSINNWDTSSMQHMRNMFNNATSFQQPIYNWNVTGVTNALDFMLGCNYSRYGELLSGWAPQNVQNGVNINFGNSRYGSANSSFRSTLVNKGWTITDGGQ